MGSTLKRACMKILSSDEYYESIEGMVLLFIVCTIKFSYEDLIRFLL